MDTSTTPTSPSTFVPGGRRFTLIVPFSHSSHTTTTIMMPVLAPGLSMGNLGHVPSKQSRSPSPAGERSVFSDPRIRSPSVVPSHTRMSSPSAMPQWAVPEIPESNDGGDFSPVSTKLVNESAMDKVGGVDAKAITPIRDMPPIRDAPPLRRSTRPRSSRGSDASGHSPSRARSRTSTQASPQASLRNKHRINPRAPVTKRISPYHKRRQESRKIYGVDHRYSWYRSSGPVHLDAPPKPPRSVAIKEGDFFVHQVFNTDEVQLWLRRASDTADVPPYWEPIVVGEHRRILDKTYTLSLNQAGQPIWVKPSTQEKREKFISSNSQAPSGSSSSSDAASTSTLSDSSSIYGDYLDHE